MKKIAFILAWFLSFCLQSCNSRQMIDLSTYQDTHRVKNQGVAPTHHDYNLVLKLEGPVDVAKKIAETDNKNWLPGSESTLTFSVDIPASVPGGIYQVKIKIIDHDDTGRDVDFA